MDDGSEGILRPLPRDICTDSAKAQTDKRDEVPGQTPRVSAAGTLVRDVRSFRGGGEMTPVELENELEEAVRFLIKP